MSVPPGASARHFVTAVLVVHDGARWLPEVISALAEQTRAPDVIRVVDTGSTDRSREILAEAVGDDQVLRLPRRTGFGEAVSAVLDRPADPHRGRRAMVQPGEQTSWLWLIHDDSAPAPDALEKMLGAADGAGRRRTGPPGVLGAKHRDWYDRKVLLEVGLTTDMSGRRESGVDRGEYDQGQYDDVRDVLAVDTAGMLIRRDVWDQLGGFDPRLPLYRDDVDFCWRATRAGHNVALVTEAVVFHAEAGARRRRTVHATANHPRLADRRHGMYSLATNLPLGLAALALLRNVVTSIVRAVGWVLVKQPGFAFDELAAVLLTVVRPDMVIRGRRARRRLPKRWRYVKALMPPRGAALRRVGERIAAFNAGAVLDNRHGAVASTEPPGEDDDAFGDIDSPSLFRRALKHPGFLLVVALTVVALIAERHVLGMRVAGGALLPAGDLTDLWRTYLATWHPVGLGSTTTAPPMIGALALLSTLLGGQVWLAVDVLLLGCVPLAGWSAYLASARLGRDRSVRVWLSAAYALLPVATGAISAGRLGTAVAFVLLPLLAYFVARVLDPARSSLRAAWAGGLVLSVAAAFAPVLWPMALLLGLIAAATLRGRRGMLPGLAITGLLPLLLLYPWSLTLVAHPSLLLLDTGYHPAYLAAPRLHPVALLLLHPGGPGMYPVWMSAGLVVAALAALLFRVHRGPVQAGWVVAIVGLVAGIVLSRVTVAEPGATTGAVVWPGIAAAVVGVGLLVAVGAAAQDAPQRLFRFGFGWRQLGVVALVIVAGAAPLLAGAWWLVGGVEPPLHKVTGSVVPEYLTATSGAPDQARTLVLRQAGSRADPEGNDPLRVEYTVIRGTAPVLGDELVQPPRAVRQRLDGIVGDLVSGRSTGVMDRLQPYGIRYVLLAGPVDRRLAQRLDAESGLVRQSQTRSFALWQGVDRAGRVRVDGGDDSVLLAAPADGDTTVRVPAGGSGRTLVLADAASSGWTATLDGRPLAPRVVDGWGQGFALPSGGGEVRLEHVTSIRHVQLFFEGLAVLVVVILALPGARREEDAHDEDGDDPGEAVPLRHRRLPQAVAPGVLPDPVAPGVGGPGGPGGSIASSAVGPGYGPGPGGVPGGVPGGGYEPGAAAWPGRPDGPEVRA